MSFQLFRTSKNLWLGWLKSVGVDQFELKQLSHRPNKVFKFNYILFKAGHCFHSHTFANCSFGQLVDDHFVKTGQIMLSLNRRSHFWQSFDAGL